MDAARKKALKKKMIEKSWLGKRYSIFNMNTQDWHAAAMDISQGGWEFHLARWLTSMEKFCGAL
jgi:hypothetical protein